MCHGKSNFNFGLSICNISYQLSPSLTHLLPTFILTQAPPNMCKQYVYYELCGSPLCSTAISRKHRNVYCREALDARRLGRCSEGVVTITQRLPGRQSLARCTACKTPLPTQSHSTTESTSVESASMGAEATKLRNRKKLRSYCIFEHVFEDALNAEVRKAQHVEGDWCPDTSDSYCVVEDAVAHSEEGSGESNQGRQNKRRRLDEARTEEGGSTGYLCHMLRGTELLDPYGLQQSYRWERRY